MDYRELWRRHFIAFIKYHRETNFDFISTSCPAAGEKEHFKWGEGLAGRDLLFCTKAYPCYLCRWSMGIPVKQNICPCDYFINEANDDYEEAMERIDFVFEAYLNNEDRRIAR